MNIYPRIMSEPLYIRDELEKACVRTDPTEKAMYLKFDGKEEALDKNSDTANTILLQGNEITKEQYESY